MKSYIVGLSFLLCFSANAADWSPVFKHLEVGKNGDQGKTIASLTQGIFRSDSTITMGDKLVFKKDILSTNSKKGVYNVSPIYRQDLLPAKLIKSNNERVEAVIPLKNATLYGLKIKSFNYGWGCTECGDVWFFATFAPMSNDQYQELKNKVHFQTYADDEENICGIDTSGKIYKRDNEVYLAVNLAC